MASTLGLTVYQLQLGVSSCFREAKRTTKETVTGAVRGDILQLKLQALGMMLCDARVPFPGRDCPTGAISCCARLLGTSVPLNLAGWVGAVRPVGCRGAKVKSPWVHETQYPQLALHRQLPTCDLCTHGAFRVSAL